MKRKPIWKELNLPPPSKRSSIPSQTADPVRQEASQKALRSNCVRALALALATAPSSQPASGKECVKESNSRELADVSVPAPAANGLAEAIERELFNRHQAVTGQEYKAAARTLVAGLKRNHELRQRVLAGDVPAVAVAALGARELATSEQQHEYASIQERETRRVTLSGRGSASLELTSDYTCGRCGGRSCDYLDTGRRDIGKCETWGSKDGQGSSRLVSCLGCGNRWEVDDL